MAPCCFHVFPTKCQWISFLYPWGEHVSATYSNPILSTIFPFSTSYKHTQNWCCCQCHDMMTCANFIWPNMTKSYRPLATHESSCLWKPWPERNAPWLEATCSQRQETTSMRSENSRSSNNLRSQMGWRPWRSLGTGPRALRKLKTSAILQLAGNEHRSFFGSPGCC